MQFTTLHIKTTQLIILFSKSKSTRFRCNSQLFRIVVGFVLYCFQRAKVQDLDAIHNIQRANYFLTFSSSCLQRRQLKSNKHYHSSIIMRLCHWITLVNLGQWLRLRCFFPPWRKAGVRPAGRVVLTANFANFANFSKICFLYRFFLILSRKSITH